MKTFLQRVVTLVIMSIYYLSVSAYDFEADGIYYDISSFTELTATASSLSEESEGLIVIPSTVEFNGKTLQVTTVGKNFALGNDAITTVEISEGIRTVSEYAFDGCSQLNQVTLAATEKLEKYAFSNCSSLRSINFSENIISLGDNCFEACSSLASISLPESVTALGSSCFRNCTKLEDVILPNITVIPELCFSGCTSLSSITFSEKLKSIESRAFSETGFTTFTIPNSVTTIGTEILSNCSELISFTIGSGLNELSSNPIEGCGSIKELIISDSVNKLQIGFNGNLIDKLTYGEFEYYIYNGGWTSLPIEKLYIGREVSSKEKEKTDKYLLYYCYTPPFSNNKSIKEVEIGPEVTDLPPTRVYHVFHFLNDYGYFAGCSTLESVVLSTSLKEISDKMFTGTAISEITVPNKIKNIGAEAFAYCENLRSVTIGQRCNFIGDNAFVGDNALEKISIYASTPPTCASGFSNTQYLNTQLNIPPSTLNEYKETEPWSNFWKIEEDEDLISEFIIQSVKYEIIDSKNVAVVGCE